VEIIDISNFKQWLEQYGKAWEDGDPEAIVRIFTSEATYQETPFDPPMVGTQGIHQYWTEGAKMGQTEVKFEAIPITFENNLGFAHWRASFNRVSTGAFVELEGILSAQFDETKRCLEFKEWWHRKES
jgi:ketosteroid isomerase-like protein